MIKLLLALPVIVFSQNPCGPQGSSPVVLNGLQVRYFDNERTKIAEKANYKDGMLEGELVRYYYEGGIHSKEQYQANRRSGECLYYYPSGKLESKRFYWLDSQTKWQQYYDDGSLKAELTNGKQINYYPNGQIESDASQNIQNFYYENGQFKYKLEYKNHQMILNEVVVYYPSWKIMGKEKYIAGQRTGNWVSYYENGNIKEQVKCNSKSKSGSFIEYYPNGTVKTVWHFVLNSQDGKPLDKNLIVQGSKLYFDETENILKKESYCRGLLFREISFENGKASKWVMRFGNDNTFLKLYDSIKKLPSSEGELEGNLFRYHKIKNRKGKTLYSGGNGEYFGEYSLVDESYLTDDSLQGIVNISYQEYYRVGGFIYDWSPLMNVPMRSLYETHRPAFLMPRYAMAKGKFKDGFKEGEWIEGDFFDLEADKKNRNDGEHEIEPKIERINLEGDNSCYAIGKYVKGLREGHWKLFTGDIVFEGEFKNGKRTGVWRANPVKIEPNKNGWGYFNGYNPPYRPLVRGFYKDGLADSCWTIYHNHTDTITQVQFYIKGWHIGNWSEYYRNGNIKMQAYLSADTLVKKYYSPLGDELKYIERGDINTYYTMQNGTKNGISYRWYYGGEISERGSYLNGQKEGDWYEFGYWGDTIGFYQYVNGRYNGRYEHTDYTGQTKGMMKDDERTGTWLEAMVDEKRECNYVNGKMKLINCWQKGKQIIKNGKGVMTRDYSGSYSPHSVKKEDIFFENCERLYSKEYYTNGSMKSLKYFTAHGDSLVTYNSPYGGLCINSGEGVITEYDGQNRIKEINYYEGGRLQKTEYYRFGKYTHGNIYFASKFDKQPVVKRTITQTKDGNYLVEVNIAELTNSDGFQKLVEFIPEGSQAINKESAGATINQKLIGISYIWVKNDASNFSVSYILKLPKGQKLSKDYPGEFSYISNKSTFTVKIAKENILVEVK